VQHSCFDHKNQGTQDFFHVAMIPRIKATKASKREEDSRPLLGDDEARDRNSQDRILFSAESDDDDESPVARHLEARAQGSSRSSPIPDRDFAIGPPLRSTIQSREARKHPRSFHNTKSILIFFDS